VNLENAIRKAQRVIRSGELPVVEIYRKREGDARYLPWGCMRTPFELLNDGTRVVETPLSIQVRDFDHKYKVVTE
jgi:hypothetical protein